MNAFELPEVSDERTRRAQGRGRNARLTLAPEHRNGARIKVVGVGGGGSNAVDRMVEVGLSGVEFIVANTDVQALDHNQAGVKIQIGRKLTKGLGAGADPNIGRQAALEDTDTIIQQLSGADMIFVTTGLGGGPARARRPSSPASRPSRRAHDRRRRSHSVSRKEACDAGRSRTRSAARGHRHHDSQRRLLSIIDRKTPLTDAFTLADDVLRQAIQGISDLILVPGLINLDFADENNHVGDGRGQDGDGTSEGDGRAMQAAQRAISSPLLEDSSVHGARGVIINVTGGPTCRSSRSTRRRA